LDAEVTFRFRSIPSSADVELQLFGPDGPVAVDEWATRTSDTCLGGVDLAHRLLASELAVAEGDTVLIEHRAVAGFSAREASLLGLPASAPAVAHVRTTGTFGRPDFGVTLEWRRPTGQAIVAPVRCGAFLRIGQAWHRLPDPLFSIAESVDRLERAGTDEAERYRAFDELQDALPAAQADGAVQASGLAGSMTIAVADAFSLDLQGEGENARLIPTLHRSGDNAPLLPEPFDRAFGDRHFGRFGTARPAYALGNATYVVLTPVLKRALDVVRATQAAPLAAKRALMASPRTVLRQALGDDVEETVLEALFQETAAYSERVIGLGLWRKRVLPWLPMSSTDWFEAGSSGTPGNTRSEAPRRVGGIALGDRLIELSAEQADVLRRDVERAIGQGEAVVRFSAGDEIVTVPASHDTLTALQKLEDARARATAAPSQDAPGATKNDPEVLLIRPNENEIEVEGAFSPRNVPQAELPVCLATQMKAHQTEGLAWLRGAYAMGRPGVLLADDMGLGKTLQGLAFLAWLREGMQSGALLRAPVAVVAPTGLLQNWRAEEDRHLARPGLGRCLEAFGKGLAGLKGVAADGRPALDRKALAEADWVLTTYETLREYDRDFGAVRFAAMLFDEAQKIKTPGTRITDAAKAMDADFRVALTGTPVENRLSDLWCITDAVHPAFLGDLKSFSRRYEATAEANGLRKLKASLDAWYGGRPPLLLRRLKRDRLPDLPQPDERIREAAMPPMQRAAYEAAVEAARAAAGQPGAILHSLQRLRAISLHPDPQMPGDEAFIGASARCRLAFAALDEIAEAGERALVFVDDLDFQARLAGVIQRRYRLATPPMILNGSVSGAARQRRVDRFQANTQGFDAMILSPRAGGVGLTLTAANHVIHLSRWWNPAVEDQCTGRVLRIGQTRPVAVHLPLAVLDGTRASFDRNLDALIQRKRKLFHEAFMPPEPSEDERDELFRATVT